MTAHMSRVVQSWGASQSCAYCHGFAKIPPLIRGTDGRMHVNPDFSMIKQFSVRAEPFGYQLQPGEARDFVFTVPAEDNALGDLLINELLAVFTPDTTRGITAEFLSAQTDKTFQNGAVYNTLLFGNSHLNCCLPCCTLVQATNSLIMRLTNTDTVPVEARVVAKGKRFLPKSEELRARMLMYWNQIPSYPSFLTLDDLQVRVDAGAGPVVAEMTIQGTGDFEPKWPRCEVIAAPGAPGTPSPNDIMTTITSQVGREFQSDPLPLGAFVATPTLSVAGFPGDLYRAASACHCPPATQLFKRNQKIRFEFNNIGSFDALVRFTYAGCFHKVDECPPGYSIDRIKSLEPTIGPLLIPQDDYCPPKPEPEYYPDELGPMPQAPQYQAPPQPQGMPQAPQTMYAAVPGGAAVVQPGGPLSYMYKYYQPGGGGMATPQAQAAAAHGYGPQFPMPTRHSLNGLGSQHVVQKGELYWDAITKEFRRA